MLSVNSTCGGRKSITALSQSYDGHERPVWWSRHIFHWPLCIGSPNVYLNTVELSNARIRDRCVRPRVFGDAASHKEKSFTVAVLFFCSSKIKHESSKISAAVASLLIWAALATQLSLPVATSGGKKTCLVRMYQSGFENRKSEQSDWIAGLALTRASAQFAAARLFALVCRS